MRGTYLPFPVESVVLKPVYSMTFFDLCWLTGLGEEGREALIRVGSFALFGQVSIGLDVHRTLAIQVRYQDIPQRGSGLDDVPECRAPGSRAECHHELASLANKTNSPGVKNIVWAPARTSQQELAIWQPAWPTVRVISCQLVFQP